MQFGKLENFLRFTVKYIEQPSKFSQKRYRDLKLGLRNFLSAFELALLMNDPFLDTDFAPENRFRFVSKKGSLCKKDYPPQMLSQALPSPLGPIGPSNP